MIILTIRTDNPMAEVGLYVDQEKMEYVTWEAHRQLAETIHIKLKDLLISQKLDWNKIDGIVCYQGPGSFTGLRIGLSVANALASSLHIPIVATTSEDWVASGISQLREDVDKRVVLPEYGQPVHITKPRK